MKTRPGFLKIFVVDAFNRFKSEYFLDALRITISIILPFAAFYYFGDPRTAIAVGVGALLISLTDSPGTLKDKALMSVSSLCIFFIVSLITAVLIKNIILSGLLILVLCFAFSLFTAFGKRYALLGTMALILMTFVQGLKPLNPVSFSCYIAIGGIWYYMISLVQTWLWPLSSVRHALGECMMSTADFLKAKANFYHAGGNLQDNYLQIIKLHNKVSEKQEQVRDLLLRDQQLMKENHLQGQRHLLATAQVIDLYELISAIHYDYSVLQEDLKDTGLLESITKVIGLLATDLHILGKALSAKSRLRSTDLAIKEIELLKSRMEILIADKRIYAAVLTKLQGNIEDIYQGIRQIKTTLMQKAEELYIPADLPAYQFFTTAETINLDSLKQHMDFKSPVFRFALRLSFACIVAYSLTFLPVGFYSYWILLTVIVVIKPGFGLTKKRNIQRLQGSLGGVLIGAVLLLLIHSTVVQLILAGLFLLGYFAYLRLNYALSILSLTPMIIISLSIYTGNSSVVPQRILDTIIGCAIAFATSYLFPSWEAKRHALYIRDVIAANLKYLKKLQDQARGVPLDVTAFKLARKEVYTKLAILSTGVQNMLLEPKRAQTEVHHLYEFQILSHQLSSTIASFFPFSNSNGNLDKVKVKIDSAIGQLERSLEILKDPAIQKLAVIDVIIDHVPDALHADEIEYHKMQQILRISEAVKNQAYDLRDM